MPEEPKWDDPNVTWDDPTVSWDGYNIVQAETAERLNPSRSNILVPQGNLLKRRKGRRG